MLQALAGSTVATEGGDITVKLKEKCSAPGASREEGGEDEGKGKEKSE